MTNHFILLFKQSQLVLAWIHDEDELAVFEGYASDKSNGAGNHVKVKFPALELQGLPCYESYSIACCCCCLALVSATYIGVCALEM